MERCLFIKSNNEQCKRFQRVDNLCKQHNKLKPIDCSICYTEITKKDRCELKCEHIFHRLCINKWSDSNLNNTCPMCRAKFDKETIEFKITGISDMKKKGRGFQFLVSYENSNEKVWIPGKKVEQFFKQKKELKII